MKSLNFLVAVCLMVATLAGCKRKCNDPSDPACPNYNPCAQYERLSANFTISERLELGSHLWEPESDSVWSGHLAKFSVVARGLDSFRWFIGIQTFTDSVVYKRGFPNGIPIPVTLVAYFKSHAGCGNNASGIDTVTKYVYSIRDFFDLPVNGVYYGHNTDAPGEGFTIQVNDTSSNMQPDPGAPYGRSYCIQGLPKGAPDVDFRGQDAIVYGARHIYFDASLPWSVTDVASNYGLLLRGTRTGDSITIDYQYDQNGLDNALSGTSYSVPHYVSKRFVGKWLRPY